MVKKGQNIIVVAIRITFKDVKKGAWSIKLTV